MRSRVRSGLRVNSKFRRTGPNRTKPHGSQDRWFPLRVAAPGDPSNQGYHWGIWSQKDPYNEVGVGRPKGTHPPYTIGEFVRPKIPMAYGGSKPQWNPTKRGHPLSAVIRFFYGKSPPDGSRNPPQTSRNSPKLPDTPGRPRIVENHRKSIENR